MKTEIKFNNKIKLSKNNSVSKDRLSNTLSPIYSENLNILMISTYSPRECGIASYTQDLINSIQNGFGGSFSISICALQSTRDQYDYSDEVSFILNTDDEMSYKELAYKINSSTDFDMVLLQHEFGLFEHRSGSLIDMLKKINIPISIVFHTVLPSPNDLLSQQVKQLVQAADAVIVMTSNSYNILIKDYNIKESKIQIIPHGTHLINYGDKYKLKEKYGFGQYTILTTFGFLGKGKSIETTLEALPDIIAQNPNILFLIIGKTHPSTIRIEGEAYRNSLLNKIKILNIDANVLFINSFLPLKQLLEYLQLTDIYIFTSKDPNQAVSGTFSYAISCGCPIISTPIPHAKEVLKNDAGILIDFNSSAQLSSAVNQMLLEEDKRIEMSNNGLKLMLSTAWQNAAISHIHHFKSLLDAPSTIKYCMPQVNLTHIKRLTTEIGIIQFSKINIPDLSTGYTLDDNARALIAVCQHYVHFKGIDDLKLIQIYIEFIKRCLQNDGTLLNYLDINLQFTLQNKETNLEDSNGRALWALGFIISNQDLLPLDIVNMAYEIFNTVLKNLKNIHSTRAMAFAIKGIYFANLKANDTFYDFVMKMLAQRLYKMYLHESEKDWQWYESYLTYGNSLLPEAMLMAYLATDQQIYKQVAKESFDFLLSKIFQNGKIQAISNQTWMHKGIIDKDKSVGGEQPIEVAYTILALQKFNMVFDDQSYMDKMNLAFEWFLGNNHLKQIMYNPCTGGCYDGLEEHNVNLNQGAESTVSYLMARMIILENKRELESFSKTVKVK